MAEPRRGYGRACRAGAQAVRPDCSVILFLDGDGSDCPEFVPALLAPIAAGTHDFVIGSRLRGRREAGSMTPQQLAAGRLAGLLCRLVYGVRYTDMSPFRAIRRDALSRLGMAEETYGWNLEMQMRAALAGLRIREIPVDHRRRAGGEFEGIRQPCGHTARGGAHRDDVPARCDRGPPPLSAGACPASTPHLMPPARAACRAARRCDRPGRPAGAAAHPRRGCGRRR